MPITSRCGPDGISEGVEASVRIFAAQLAVHFYPARNWRTGTNLHSERGLEAGLQFGESGNSITLAFAWNYKTEPAKRKQVSSWVSSQTRENPTLCPTDRGFFVLRWFFIAKAKTTLIPCEF
jgi:hypothetical protein